MYIQDAEWRFIVNPAEKREDTYNLIETIGRTCYQSEVKDIPDHGAKFVRQIVKRGHLGLLEHVNMTIEFLVDRGTTHEIVRHRHASFAQESTRYCVAGETRLTTTNPHNRPTVAELYKLTQASRNGAWKRMKVRQYDERNGEIRYAGVKSIVHNGERECVEITTSLGYKLICTPDHQVLTPGGYVEAQGLATGSRIYVNGTEESYKNKDWLYHQAIQLGKTFTQIAAETGFNASTLKKWARKHELPKRGTGFFNVNRTPWNKGIADSRQVEPLRKYHHCGRRNEGIMKEDTSCYQKRKAEYCALCGTTDSLEVHHKDKNHANNMPENLITLCESCHQRVHSRNLLVAYADEVVSIVQVGKRNVYDIEMDSEFHNFIADGVVVHNCNYSKGKFEHAITVINIDTALETDPLTKDMTPEEKMAIWLEWRDGCKDAEKHYFRMLELGASPQIARGVLPTSLKSELKMTANLREWRHFFALRALELTGPVHPQMLEVAWPVYEACLRNLPEVFHGIGPKDVE